MADKLVIYNPESNDASHTPSDTVKGNITIDGDIWAQAITPGYINLGDRYRFYWANNSDEICLEPTDKIHGTHQKYTFGGNEGIFIERNSPSSVSVIYCETKTASSDDISKMKVLGTGDIWGDRWKNNGRKGYQYMLSEYIDTLTYGDLTSGWTRLQNGLLLQWGTISGSKQSYAQITFPTAFTKVKKVFPVVIDTWRSDGWVPVIYAASDDTNMSKQGIFCRQINGTEGPSILENWTANWFAIGY